MSSRPDLYAVLGVPRTATTEELTAAYRRRARTTHPDAGGDALAFRAVSKAYDVLKDPGLRAGYDAELDDAPSGLGPSQPRQPGGQAENPDASAGPPRASGPRRKTASCSASAEPRRPMSAPFGPSSGVDLGQIPWAQPFLDLEAGELRRRLRLVPGRSRLVLRGLLWAATLAWCIAGIWIGRVRLPGDGDSPLWALWVLVWWVAAAVVGVQVLRRRISLLLVPVAGLAWPAYAAPGTVWAWTVFSWLAGALALPLALTAAARPSWSVRRVRAGNVFGEASWHGRVTEPLVCDLLVIPAARLLHQVAGAEHAVVLDRKVALVGTSAAPAIPGCQVRVWPLEIINDPARAVEEMGRWLLAGTDGWSVDRRALAAVH